jgi:hypothetical protein
VWGGPLVSLANLERQDAPHTHPLQERSAPGPSGESLGPTANAGI